MKKWLRLFAGGFWFTVIVVSVFAAMFYCSNNAQMAAATEGTALLEVAVRDEANDVSLTLMGTPYRIDCKGVVWLESLRRRYYYLLPMGVKLMEQAVCHTVNELTALASGAQKGVLPSED